MEKLFSRYWDLPKKAYVLKDRQDPTGECHCVHAAILADVTRIWCSGRSDGLTHHALAYR